MSPSIGQIFEKVGLVVGSRLTPELEREMCLAGYDRDTICDSEGPQSERFHDALFATESIARAVIGSNLVRISYSMEACTELMATRRPDKIVDIGGGCGIVCFDAAAKFPDSQFTNLDRSYNALSIGREWARRLDLENFVFVRREFLQTECAAENICDNGLALLEYVLDLAPACDDEDSIIIQMTPAIEVASQLIRTGGALQVRFGEFQENGFTALIRSAFRSGLVVESVDVTAHGHAVIFEKRTTERGSENQEVDTAMNDLSSAFWRLPDLHKE